MKQPIKLQKKSTGFTLVEIMIAIAISMILMLGVMQIFSSNKRSHVISNGLARVQENIRFAMKDISYAGRMAGYVGCSGNIKNHLDENDPAYSDDLFNFDAATGGWEFTASNTKPDGSYTVPASLAPDADATHWKNNDTSGTANATDLLAALMEDASGTAEPKVLPGTDVLVLKWAGSNADGVAIKNMNTNSASITTYSASNVEKDSIVIVSDCSGGDAFMNVSNANASSVSKGTANGHPPGNKNPSSSKWSHVYPESADFLYFVSRAFYIGLGASGEPALFRSTFFQGATEPSIEEIAEGIENMQVLFGIDVNADNYADRYVSAVDVPSHDAVVSVKLALLARTPEEIKEAASPNSYKLLGTTITTPSDRRVRYAFNTTIKLRNKGKK